MFGIDGVEYYILIKMLMQVWLNYDLSIVCKESCLELKQLCLWCELSLKIGYNVCKIKVKLFV